MNIKNTIVAVLILSISSLCAIPVKQVVLTKGKQIVGVNFNNYSMGTPQKAAPLFKNLIRNATYAPAGMLIIAQHYYEDKELELDEDGTFDTVIDEVVEDKFQFSDFFNILGSNKPLLAEMNVDVEQVFPDSGHLWADISRALQQINAGIEFEDKAEESIPKRSIFDVGENKFLAKVRKELGLPKKVANKIIEAVIFHKDAGLEEYFEADDLARLKKITFTRIYNVAQQDWQRVLQLLTKLNCAPLTEYVAKRHKMCMEQLDTWHQELLGMGYTQEMLDNKPIIDMYFHHVLRFHDDEEEVDNENDWDEDSEAPIQAKIWDTMFIGYSFIFDRLIPLNALVHLSATDAPLRVSIDIDTQQAEKLVELLELLQYKVISNQRVTDVDGRVYDWICKHKLQPEDVQEDKKPAQADDGISAEGFMQGLCAIL